MNGINLCQDMSKKYINVWYFQNEQNFYKLATYSHYRTTNTTNKLKNELNTTYSFTPLHILLLLDLKLSLNLAENEDKLPAAVLHAGLAVNLLLPGVSARLAHQVSTRKRRRFLPLENHANLYKRAITQLINLSPATIAYINTV